MKRRNAESGKMRRPVKRTKITEGMYGNSLLYLKFVMLWATVVLADYMLEFRFEFLWPFWMMLRSVYDSFKYQGIAFSVFFICIALTSDMICYFFIPVQYIFFAASTYVWVQYVWYTFADKGICLPTVFVCCAVVWVEGALREGAVGAVGAGEGRLSRPLAAHCVGFPAVTLGVGVRALALRRLRQRRQRQVRAENEFYFQLLRDALPESALEQQPQPSPPPATKEAEAEAQARPNGAVRRRCVKLDQNGHCTQEHAQLQFKLEKLEQHLAKQTREKAANCNSVNGNSQGSCGANANSKDSKDGAHGKEANSHSKENGHTHSNSKDNAHTHSHSKENAHAHSQSKENTHAQSHSKENAHTHNHSKENGHAHGNSKENAHAHSNSKENAHTHSHSKENAHAHSQSKESSHAHSQSKENAHAHSNGVPPGHREDDDKHEHIKATTKSSKCEKKETSIKEEKRKNKNRDKDKESSDSHKSTDQNKEQIVKELEIVKECVKNKECNSFKEKEKEKEKDKEKGKEKDKESEQREREPKERHSEEVRRLRAEVATARGAEAEARRALAAAAAADRQRRADLLQLRQAHAALQHKVSGYRGSERAAAALERRLSEERRARSHAETQLRLTQRLLPAPPAPLAPAAPLTPAAPPTPVTAPAPAAPSPVTPTHTTSGECESDWCRSRRTAHENEATVLRREVQRMRENNAQLQRDLAHASDQVRTLEAQQEESSSSREESEGRLASAWAALHERAQHLERALSAETRVKLDLLSALGDAKRHLTIQEGVISRQEKEIEELKAQLLAVLPPELAALDAWAPRPDHAPRRLNA